MKINLLVLLFAFITVQVYAQRASVKGVVLDSLDKTPLEFATVAVVNPKDSSLVSYTLTDKAGNFLLRNLPAGVDFKLVASFVAFNNFRRNINLKKGEEHSFGTIRLTRKELNEVVVTGAIVPVIVKKDTIEFNAEAFKTRPNAVVEELLKKLPGVQVDNDGTITVNGKNISKLTIDGKEFFGDDPKVASKNLNADLIAKVEIFDDRENDPDRLLDASKVNKIINLKLKKAIKRSIFGKVYGGGGSLNRFESGGLLNMFRDTLQVSIIGVGNNLNRTGFSSNELYNMGGFNRSGQDDIWNGSVSLGGRSWGGMERVGSGGFNLNNDYGKKLKMNLMYFYNNTERVYENTSSHQQFLKDTTSFSNSTGKSTNREVRHTVNGSINWNPDTLTNIQFRPRFAYINGESEGSNTTRRRNNFVSQVNESFGSNIGTNNRVQFQQTLTYHRRLKKKGESLNISHFLQANPSGGDNYVDNELISFVETQPSQSLYQYTNRKSRNTSANLNINYRYPFSKKITGSIGAGADYLRTGEMVEMFNRNETTGAYDILNADQSNDLMRERYMMEMKTGIRYSIKSFSVDINLSGQRQNIADRFRKGDAAVKQQYFFLLPSLNISFKQFSLSYGSSVNLPYVSDLQPITITYGPLYSFTGNPSLKPGRNHSGNLNYHMYKHESRINFNAYWGGTLEENAVVRRRTIQASGAQTSTPINMNGRFNSYLGSHFRKQFKKVNHWQISVHAGINGNLNRNYFQQNLDEGWENNYSLGFTPGFSLNWKDIIDLSPSYNINQAITDYRGVTYEDVNTRTHNLNTRFMVRWPKKIIWEGNYEYKYNPMIAPGFRKSNNLLNFAVSLQMLKKDKGQLKLSVYDLLDQNIPSYRYASENSIFDHENKILRRYFLLTYVWNFNKTMTK